MLAGWLAVRPYQRTSVRILTLFLLLLVMERVGAAEGNLAAVLLSRASEAQRLNFDQPLVRLNLPPRKTWRVSGA